MDTILSLRQVLTSMAGGCEGLRLGSGFVWRTRLRTAFRASAGGVFNRLESFHFFILRLSGQSGLATVGALSFYRFLVAIGECCILSRNMIKTGEVYEFLIPSSSFFSVSDCHLPKSHFQIYLVDPCGEKEDNLTMPKKRQQKLT